MEKNEKVTRRKFLRQTAAGVALVSSGVLANCSKPKQEESESSAMPTRTLGNTSLQVSLLTFGGGSQFLKNKDGEWEPILERAIELGINLYDTASTYQWQASMSSEERFGLLLPKYRKKIYISTKFESRKPSEALKEFERSLKRMKTDYVDILFIHSIEPSDTVADLEKGVYKELVRLKEQGVARYIGFSCMDSAERSRELLEKLAFDVVLLAMNPTKYGNFAQIALPAAVKKNVGVIAMKVMRGLVGKEATAEELLHYALSQESVASALIGHYRMEVLEENARLVKKLADMPTLSFVQRKKLEAKLAHLAGPHALCWARPDYVDGAWA